MSGASRKDMRRNGNVSRCILPSGRRISIRRRRFPHLSGLSILAENSLFSSGEYYTKNTCLSAPISGLRNNRANTAMYRHAESSRSRFDNATFPRTEERNQHSFRHPRKLSYIISLVRGTLSYFFLRLRKHSPARAFNLGDDFRSGPVVFPSSGDAPQRGKLFRGTGFPKDIGSHKSAPPGIGVR